MEFSAAYSASSLRVNSFVTKASNVHWACPVIGLEPANSFTHSRVLPAAKERRRQREELNRYRTWIGSGCPWPRQSTESCCQEKHLVKQTSLVGLQVGCCVSLVGPSRVLLAQPRQIGKA